MEDNQLNLDHHPLEMMMGNIQTIKRMLDEFEKIASDPLKAKRLADLALNHAWMVDHIATSADDIQEAMNFAINRTGSEVLEGLAVERFSDFT
jgi:hypothetical protein